MGFKLGFRVLLPALMAISIFGGLVLGPSLPLGINSVEGIVHADLYLNDPYPRPGGDQAVSLSDALFIQQSLDGTGCELKPVVDTDGDGTITASDIVSSIQNYGCNFPPCDLPGPATGTPIEILPDPNSPNYGLPGQSLVLTATVSNTISPSPGAQINCINNAIVVDLDPFIEDDGIPVIFEITEDTGEGAYLGTTPGATTLLTWVNSSDPLDLSTGTAQVDLTLGDSGTVKVVAYTRLLTNPPVWDSVLQTFQADFPQIIVGSLDIHITSPANGALLSTSVTDVTVTTTTIVDNTIYLKIDGVTHSEISHVVADADWDPVKGWYEFTIPNVDLWIDTPGDRWVPLIAVIEATGGMSNIVSIYTDTTSPSVNITEPATGETITTNRVTVIASCSDGGSAIASCRVWVDGKAGQDSPGVFILSDGPHTAYARATDNAGNDTLAAPVPFDVFTGIIWVTITSPTDGTIFATQDIPISGTYINAGADPTITANGTTMTDDGTTPNGNWSGVVDTGAEGSVTITVTADDTSNIATASVIICVDTLNPIVSIDPLSCQTSSTVVVTGTADETGSCGPVSVVVNPGAVIADVGEFNWSATLTLPEGMGQAIDATATDAAGNTTATSTTVDVDQQAPAVTITSPTDGKITNSTTVTVNGTAIDLDSGVAVVFVNGQTAAGTANWSFTFTNQSGNPSYSAVAVDSCGNQSSPQVVRITIDLILPTAELVSPAEGSCWTSSAVEADAICNDVGSQVASCRVRIDGGSWQDVPATISGLSDGPHTAAARAIDRGGNESLPDLHNFIVDTTAPIVTISSPTPDSWRGPTVVVAGTVSDAIRIGDSAMLCLAPLGEECVIFKLSPLATPTYSESGSLDADFGDVDGDGDLDIVVANHNGQNRLYINDGNGTFTDTTFGPDTIPGTADDRMPLDSDLSYDVELADVDGDLDLDIFISDYGQNRLYLNDGNGSFSDVTAARLPADSDQSRDAEFGDVDGDGDPDIIIANYNGQNRIYLNDVGGYFIEATDVLPEDNDRSFDIELGDVDQDSNPDIFVSNWGEQNRLYLNNGSGIFSDATDHLPEDTDYSRDADLIDVNGDYYPDLVIANYFGQNSLYLNDGYGSFTEATTGSLPPLTDNSIDAELTDIDGDGDPDIIVANYHQQNRLYLNDGSGVFRDITDPHLPADMNLSRDVDFGDVDGDGDPDIIAANYLEQNLLYINNYGTVVQTVPVDPFGNFTGTLIQVSPGNYTATVTSEDNCGNSGSALVNFMVDPTPPLVSITSPSSGKLFNVNIVVVTGTATDPDTGIYQITVNGVAAELSEGSWVSTLSGLTGGPLTLIATATNFAGNSADSAPVNILIDSTPPAISITYPISGDCITSNIMVITGVVTEDGSGVAEITAIWGAYSATAADFPVYLDVSGVAEGTTNDLIVSAEDNCGNISPVETVANIRVDATEPLIDIGYPVAGQYITTSVVVVDGSVSEYGSGVALITVQAGAYTATGIFLPIILNITMDGVYTITARVEDNCGNIGLDTIANVQVDTANPTVSISYPLNGECINSTTVLATGSVSDSEPSSGLVGVTVNGVSAEVSWGSWIATLSGLTGGSLSLIATATDNAGNSTDSVPVNILVDSTLPTVSIISPTDGAYLNSTTVVVSGMADDGTGTGITGVLVNGETPSGTYSWSITFQYGEPIEAGFRDTSGYSYGVYVTGGYAYVADWDSGLAIINVSDPANPGPPVYRDTSGLSYGVHVTGGYAYVADMGSGLAIIDVSDPANPGPPLYRDTSGLSYGVHVTGGYAYVADGPSGLAIIDVSDPANPGPPLYRDTFGLSYGVYLTGGYAYVADGPSGLAIIDVSDPANPGIPVYRDTSGWSWGVYVTGGYAYLADGGSGLAIIDVSDPANPGPPLYWETQGESYGVYVTGGYAYLADGWSGLAIIDVSDPANPGPPVYQETPGQSRGVYVAGVTEPYAYVADYNNGLRVIDVSSFNFPVYNAITMDNCGNTSLPDIVRVTIDPVAPEISIITPVDGDCLNSSTVVVTGSVSDLWPSSGLAGVTVNGQSADYDPVLGNWSAILTGQPEGSLTLIATATDAVGNSADSTPVNIFIDYTPPIVSIISPSDGAYLNTTTVVVSGTADDGTGSGIAQITVTSQTATYEHSSGTWAATLTGLGEGALTIMATAMDNCGNSSLTATVSVLIDTLPPAISIITPTNGDCVNSSTVVVTGSVSDPWPPSGIAWVTLIGVSAEVSDGSWVATLTGQSEGSLSLIATAMDIAGNSADSTPVNILVDYTLPAILITSPSSGDCINSNIMVVTGMVTDYGSGVAVIMVEAGAYSATGTSFPITLNIPADGVYTITAYVEDDCGNIGLDAVANVWVDTTLPTVSIFSPTDGAYLNSTTVVVSGTAEDLGGSGITAVFVNGETASGTYSWSITFTDQYGEPIEVGFRDTADRALEVFISGDYAYVADRLSGLAVIDVSDPANPAPPVYRDTSGDSLGVYVTGGYAYVAAYDSGLAIIDVSDPANPGPPVYRDTAGYSYGVYVTEGYAYVADWTGLAIISVSSPTNPGTPVYRDTSGSSEGVYVTGGYAYVADNLSGLAIIDVTDPANPGPPVYRDTSGNSIGVYVTGGYAYVADWGSGLAIIDVSDPANPGTPVYRDTSGGSEGVYVTGGYAYVADYDSGLAIIDVTDPANPGTPVYQDTPSYSNGVYVTGGYAYVADSLSGLRIIDVSCFAPRIYNAIAMDNCGNISDPDTVSVMIDPLPPAISIITPTNGDCLNSLTVVVSGSVDDPEPSSGIAWVTVNEVSAEVSDGSWVATLTGQSEGSLSLIATAMDFAGNPASSVPVNIFIDYTLPTVSIISPSDGAYLNTTTVVVSGTADDGTGTGIATVFVNGKTASGTYSWSITFTSNQYGEPVEVGFQDTSWWSFGVYVTGGYAYVADYGSGLAIIDVSDPANPGPPVYRDTSGNSYGVYVTGGYAYVADGDSGLAIIDVSDPPNPGPPVYRDTSDISYGIYVAGGYAYLAVRESGLAIIDVSDPTNPGPPVYRDTSGFSEGVYVTGGYAYVADGDSGLAIIDVSDPANPGPPVYRDTSGFSAEVYVTRGYAYLADDTSGLAIIDVSDPANPGPPVYQDTSGLSIGVYVTGGYAYVADYGSGLAIIDVSDPANPGPPVYRDTSGFSRGVYVTGGYAYVADHDYGLRVIDVSSFNFPVFNTIAVDNCGNTSLPDTVSVLIDTLPPAISIITPTNGDCLNNSTVVVAGSVNDPWPSSGIAWVTVNGVSAEVSDGSWVATLTGQSEGSLILIATAMDFAGNPASSVPVSITVDLTPPTVEITFPTNGATFCTSTVVIVGGCSEAFGGGVTSCVVEVDGLTGDMMDGFEIFPYLPDGVYTATLTGIDACGNGATTTIWFDVDASPPTVSITLPTDGSTVSTSQVVVKGSCSDIGYGLIPVNGCVVAVDGQTADLSGGSATFSLYDGYYTATLTATDTCGYSDSTSVSFWVQTVPLAIRITDPVDGQTLCTSGVDVTVTTNTPMGNTICLDVDGTEALCEPMTGPITHIFTNVDIFAVSPGDGLKTLEANIQATGITSLPVNIIIDTTPPLVGIIQPTQPPLVYDNKGPDIWGKIWDPTVCGPGAITYGSPTTDWMFGEASMEIGVGKVIRAQAWQTVVVPININTSGLGPTSTFSYQIWVDFDDTVLYLSGPFTGVSGPDPNVPSPWTGAVPFIGPVANWDSATDFGLGGPGALKIWAEYVVPDLVDGAENLVNLCFQIDPLADNGIYDIQLYVTPADDAYIKADGVDYDFSALNGVIEVYTPTPGMITVYDGDDVDLATPEVEIDLTVTTDAVDGQTVTIPVGAIDYTAVANGGSATLRVDNFSSGVNTLVASVAAEYCPDNIGYSNPLIVDYSYLIYVTISSPASGSCIGSQFIDVTVHSDTQNGGTVTLEVNGLPADCLAPPCECYITAGGGSCAVPDVDMVAEGSGYMIEAILIEPDMQFGFAMASNLSVDWTDPQVQITMPAEGATLCTSTVWISGSCSDIGSGIDSCIVEVNGTTGDMMDGMEVITGLWTGFYTATLTGFDDCGYGATTTISFSVDVTPPWVSITSPADGATFCTSAVTVTTTFSDVGSWVVWAEVIVDGLGPYSILGGSYTFIGLATGDYMATVMVIDTCSYSSSTSVSFSVDVTPPMVSITLPTAGSTINTSQVVVEGSCSDIGFGLYPHPSYGCVVAVDGQTADLSGGSATFSLYDGYYTATLTATDTCGYSSSTSVQFTVMTLGPPPVVTFVYPTSAPAGTWISIYGDNFQPGAETHPNTGFYDPLSMMFEPLSGGIWIDSTQIDGFGPSSMFSPGTVLDVYVTNPDEQTGICYGCFTVGGVTGFAMSIESPTDGELVVTVNGITYGSVIASIPFDLMWVNGTSPYDASGLTILADGLTTAPGGLLTVTSPTTASGRIQVACNDLAGSFGTITNVTITAYGIYDAVGPAAPDSVTITVQLGEIGVEDVTVYEAVDTFTVPVNVYYDSIFGDAFDSYDIWVYYDPAVVNVNCAAATPVLGSDPASPFYAPQFGDPTVSTCDNFFGEVHFNYDQGVSPIDPTGFFNVANINMIRVGEAGSSTDLTVGLLDFCNFSGDCYSLGYPPPGYPWSTFPTYIKSGRVDIIPPLPETEPNDDPSNCNWAWVGSVVSGEVNPSGDWDYFCFTVSAGQTIGFDIDADELGSPLDSWLELYDNTWTLLADNDDAFDPDTGLYGLDSYLSYTFATGGTYYIAVTSCCPGGGGGPGYWYNLLIREGGAPPVVTFVSPSSAPAGAWISIYGENFQPGAETHPNTGFYDPLSMMFEPLSGGMWMDSTQIDGFGPSSMFPPGTVLDVYVTNPDEQTGICYGCFIVGGGYPPVVTFVYPTSAPAGAWISIYGENFQPGAETHPNTGFYDPFLMMFEPLSGGMWMDSTQIDGFGPSSMFPPGTVLDVYVTNPDGQTGICYGCFTITTGGGLCGDTICDPCENVFTCPEDCSGICGNLVCEPGEDEFSCFEDCFNGDCGNGFCEPWENEFTCFDCFSGDCWDMICDPWENVFFCPDDCSGFCGNWVCEPGEDEFSCFEDCFNGDCGNGFCELWENEFTCPDDCDCN